MRGADGGGVSTGVWLVSLALVAALATLVGWSLAMRLGRTRHPESSSAVHRPALAAEGQAPAPEPSPVSDTTREPTNEPSSQPVRGAEAPGDPLGVGPGDSALCAELEGILDGLCSRYGVPAGEVSAGLCDLSDDRFALHDGDHVRYAASIPKLIVLLTAYQAEAEGVIAIDEARRAGLVRMIRRSSNEDAAENQRLLTLARIRAVAEMPEYGLYTPGEGGIWTGKYFGVDHPPIREPVSGHMHAATARQVLRFYWLLDHGKLVSPEASERMRQIFLDDSVELYPHKFVAALADRDVELIRKSGSDAGDHHCDSALVSGPGRRYIMVCLMQHPQGEEFLRSFAIEVDDLSRAVSSPPAGSPDGSTQKEVPPSSDGDAVANVAQQGAV